MAAMVWGVLAVVSWTTFLLILEGAVRVWPVGQVGAYSRLIAVALLAGSVLAGRSGRRRLNFTGVGRWLVVMGLVSVAINTLWFLGMTLTTATNAALLFRLDLLFVIVIGWAAGIERISGVGLLIAPLMGAGLGLLMAGDPAAAFGGRLAGDAMIVGAALGLAANAFVIRHIMTHMDEQAVACYNHLFSGLGFAALATFQGWGLPEPVHDAPYQWWWVAAMGGIAAVSLPLYYAALRRMAVWKLRVLMLTAPLLAAVVDYLVWRQRLVGWQWLGAVLLLAGAGALIWKEAGGSPVGAGDGAGGEEGEAGGHCATRRQPPLRRLADFLGDWRYAWNRR